MRHTFVFLSLHLSQACWVRWRNALLEKIIPAGVLQKSSGIDIAAVSRRLLNQIYLYSVQIEFVMCSFRDRRSVARLIHIWISKVQQSSRPCELVVELSPYQHSPNLLRASSNSVESSVAQDASERIF